MKEWHMYEVRPSNTYSKTQHVGVEPSFAQQVTALNNAACCNRLNYKLPDSCGNAAAAMLVTSLLSIIATIIITASITISIAQLLRTCSSMYSS
jgi:hypothetical protein